MSGLNVLEEKGGDLLLEKGGATAFSRSSVFTSKDIRLNRDDITPVSFKGLYGVGHGFHRLLTMWGCAATKFWVSGWKSQMVLRPHVRLR